MIICASPDGVSKKFDSVPIDGKVQALRVNTKTDTHTHSHEHSHTDSHTHAAWHRWLTPAGIKFVTCETTREMLIGDARKSRQHKMYTSTQTHVHAHMQLAKHIVRHFITKVTIKCTSLAVRECKCECVCLQGRVSLSVCVCLRVNVHRNFYYTNKLKCRITYGKLRSI